jgi:hypothetical protein
LSNKDTNIITVRVNRKVKDDIANMADSNSMNLSSLVNKILTEYTEWGRYSNELDFVTLNSDILKKIFDSIEESKLSGITPSSSRYFLNICEFIHGESDFDKFITVFNHWLNYSNFNFRYLVNNDSQKYVINHNGGTNFSIFLTNTISSNIENFGRMLSDVKIENQLLKFTIEKI